jgi:dipeptidyl-peptidase III
VAIENLQGKGDQKFVPEVLNEDLNRISSASHACTLLYGKIAEPMTATQPSSLGYPSEVAQSSYYLGDSRMLPDEIGKVSSLLEKYQIHQENTRIEKVISGDQKVYRVCQASTKVDGCRELEFPDSNDVINVVRGDHFQPLKEICVCLDEALKYTANSRQEEILQKYQESFRSGDIEPYKESQRTWVKDLKPIIETVLGFVEPYRDPFGIRAEFEGLVAVVDMEKTKILTKLVEDSAKYIRTLPWAEGAVENDRKGPFETELFESPDFTSLQGKDSVNCDVEILKTNFEALAYCSSIIFPGINLPNVFFQEPTHMHRC